MIEFIGGALLAVGIVWAIVNLAADGGSEIPNCLKFLVRKDRD